MDASVLIAFVLPEETAHRTAARFIAACDLGGHHIILPVKEVRAAFAESSLRVLLV